MKTYPESSVILPKAHIIRYRTLPEGVSGEVLVTVGSNVTPDEVVAWGQRASDYMIVDVASALGLNPVRDAEKLTKILTLRVGQALKPDDLLGKSDNRGLNRRIPKSPAKAVVSLVENGRVILQVNPERVEVKARMAGEVISVEAGYSVGIESYGSLAQGIWGNGQFFAGRFAFEPGSEGGERDLRGLADLMKVDLSLSPYTGKVIVLVRPITAEDLAVVQAHELGGLVAPSMPPDLREKAMGLKVPIILTEGFGRLQPTTKLYDMLYERRTAQAVFDATALDLRRGLRPEIIIPGGVAKVEALDPQVGQALQVGMAVRVRRAPYAGRVGVITDLPEAPQKLENGLRLPAAQVSLPTGEVVLVPQSNLESLGAAPQAEIQ